MTNLGTGVVEFFYEPAQGFVHGPAAFGKGIAKGTSSLIKNSVYGVFNGAASVTGSLTKGLAAMSMDQDFIDSQRNTSRPEHLGDGVAKGIYSLGKGVASGVGGLFLDPIKGFQKEGFTGAGKGVVKGLVGVIVKPAAGALGLVTNITEGIANTGQALEGGGAAARSRAYRPRFSSPNTEGGIHGPGTHILKGSNWSRRAAHTSIIVRSGGDV